MQRDFCRDKYTPFHHILKHNFNQALQKRKMPLGFKVDNFTSFTLVISSIFFSSLPFMCTYMLLKKITTFKPESLVRDNYTWNHYHSSKNSALRRIHFVLSVMLFWICNSMPRKKGDNYNLIMWHYLEKKNRSHWVHL